MIKINPKLIVLLQLILIPCSLLFLNKSLTAFIIFNITTFLLALINVLFSEDKKVIFFSILILFITPHFIINLNSQHFYAEPWQSDTWGEIQIINLIKEQGYINWGADGFSSKSEQYSLYPGFHFLINELQLTSALPMAVIMKFIIPLINSIIVYIMLYKIFYLFFKKEKDTNIALILFATLPYFQWFYSTAVRETVAYPLFLILLYSLLNHSSLNRLHISILIISTLFLIHHITFYLSITLIVSYFLFKKKWALPFLLPLLATSFLVFKFITPNNFSMLFKQIASTFESISSVINNYSFKSLYLGVTDIAQGDILKISLSLMYYIIPIIMIFLYAAKTKERKFSLYAFVFITFFMFIVAIRLFSNIEWGYYLSLRSLNYLWIAISTLFTYTLIKLKVNNRMLIVMLLILVVGYSVQWPDFAYKNVEAPLNPPAYFAAQFAKNNFLHGSGLLFNYENFNVRNRASAIAELGYLKEESFSWINLKKDNGEYYIYLDSNSIMADKFNQIYSSKGFSLGFTYGDLRTP